ncbi:MAG: glutamate--cysteine ligase [Thiohalomonadales bacterium]
MYTTLKKSIDQLATAEPKSFLGQRQCGLEKESLRVKPDGKLSQQRHPSRLGSALTHAYITTDYSESLLELITPPLETVELALEFLSNTHKFVYDNIDNEYLWGTSMPCIVSGEQSIPIAYYGESNQGRMKTIYRRGLANRYGGMMQVIAGIHFNYSYSTDFWRKLLSLEDFTADLRQYQDQRYFALVRNLQRFGWLIPYLFGASPAICRSFVDGLAVGLEVYDDSTYFQPFATSLRTGDIGYQNYKEGKTGIKANYDSVDAYVDSLLRATTTPSQDYKSIGIKVNGKYRQLNDNILQIENEYYSSVRPKQITDIDEKPSLALKRRGVRYVELRSLDINVFEPTGISLSQLRFLEVFMLFCTLQDSPKIDSEERKEIDINQSTTAHQGRKPGLLLQRDAKPIILKDWALELTQNMQQIAILLDEVATGNNYQTSLHEQVTAIIDPELTPSAKVLANMSHQHESFHKLSMRLSKQHQHYFEGRQLSALKNQEYRDWAQQSIQAQTALEQKSTTEFADYLQAYFAQIE